MDQTTDYETLVLSAALLQNRVPDLLDENPPEDVFRNSRNLNIFRKMKEYGPKTDLAIIHTVYPQWMPKEAPHEMVVYLTHLVSMRSRDALIEQITEAIKDPTIEFDASTAAHIAESVQEKYRPRSDIRSIDVHPYLADNFDEFLAHFEEGGIHMGLSAIDEKTRGWTPGQLITLQALAKQGKTTALVKMMHEAKTSGRRVLFCSFEMDAEELMRMYTSLATGTDLNLIRDGMVPKTKKDQVKLTLRQLRTLEEARIVDDRRQIDTVTKIRGLHTTFEPDLIIVDGMYMMTDEHGEPNGSPRAITNITRACKTLAMEREVPIIISTQSLPSKTVRGKLNMYSGGYASSYAQDSDVLLGMRRLGEYAEIEILAIRSGVPNTGYWHVDWVNGEINEVDRGDPNLRAVLDGNGGGSSPSTKDDF